VVSSAGGHLKPGSSGIFDAYGRMYISGEDGEIVVIAAGRTLRRIATDPMSELLMATPAVSNGVMFVRSARSLFAIGRPGSRDAGR
jgi:hypothetical protein